MIYTDEEKETLQRLRSRARKYGRFGYKIYRNKAYDRNLFYVVDVETNWCISPSEMMTLEGIENYFNFLDSDN